MNYTKCHIHNRLIAYVMTFIMAVLCLSTFSAVDAEAATIKLNVAKKTLYHSDDEAATYVLTLKNANVKSADEIKWSTDNSIIIRLMNGSWIKDNQIIQAFNSKGEAISQMAELNLTVSPNKLEITSFKNTTSKKVTLSRTAVTGAYQYQIMYKKAGTSGDGKSATNTQRITSTTFTFSVPTANADYVFKFRALDKNSNILFGWTDWTEAYHVK